MMEKKKRQKNKMEGGCGGPLFKAPALPPKAKPPTRKELDEDEYAPTIVPSNGDDLKSQEEEIESPSSTSTSSSSSTTTTTTTASAAEYQVPEWAGQPKHAYSLVVVKGGLEVERISISDKDRYVVGRTEGCDIVLLHPSVSRRHAVIQHRAPAHDDDPDDEKDPDDDGALALGKGGGGGVFVYDLGSTHGTFVGKRRLTARQYTELRVGDMVRFGASTRLLVLTAPDQEAVRREEERRLVLRKRAAEQRRLYPDHYRQQLANARRKEAGGDDDDGCGWGMGEDADADYEDEDEETERVLVKSEDGDTSLFQGTTYDAKAFMKKLRQEQREKKLKKLKRKGKGKKQEAVVEEGSEKKKIQELPPDKAEELKQREEERMKRAVVKEWDESFDDEDDFYDRAGGFSSAKGHTTRRVETIDSLKAKLAVLLAQKELVGLEVEEITNKNASGNSPIPLPSLLPELSP